MFSLSVTKQLSTKQRFILYSREANFSGGVKSQLVFRGTVDPKQVQGSILKGIREPSS